ncbi:hypothetical protein P3T76_013563 [Phytophthora citrophthora]|uniref:Uncharacterized protein n=1 Tax=Phytophthora citrophthora TaxID=4793 RepID=A0AAD9G2N6_9STRA|nr:hypothetical protein P3T76_013563 [Phytophthora citrophthora]
MAIVVRPDPLQEAPEVGIDLVDPHGVVAVHAVPVPADQVIDADDVPVPAHHLPDAIPIAEQFAPRVVMPLGVDGTIADNDTPIRSVDSTPQSRGVRHDAGQHDDNGPLMSLELVMKSRSSY